MLRVLDLFSGIGGFSLGLERTGGFETAAFCEIDPFCRQVLAKHWPGVPCYEDITELTGERISRDGIVADVIAGGFPCQDISEAGLRKGMQGSCSSLWREYARLISELRPRYAIVENVSDLLKRGLGEVIGDLAEIRYDAEWYSIPALAVGADHIRERIWIIAYPDSTGFQIDTECRRQQCQAQVGQDAAQNNANTNGARLSRRMQAGALCEDARAIGPRIGFALSSAPDFPRLDGAGSPVLGRGQNGIPNRVDRCHAIGNAVVPQIPEIIGRAILEAEGMRA